MELRNERNDQTGTVRLVYLLIRCRRSEFRGDGSQKLQGLSVDPCRCAPNFNFQSAATAHKFAPFSLFSFFSPFFLFPPSSTRLVELRPAAMVRGAVPIRGGVCAAHHRPSSNHSPLALHSQLLRPITSGAWACRSGKVRVRG